MTRLSFVFCFLFALAAEAREFTGARSIAMGGAQRGVASRANDSLYLNSAAMSMMERFSAEAQYGHESFTDLSHINASIIDSAAQSVDAGVGYTSDRGNGETNESRLHRFYIGLAYPISQSLSIGVTNRFINGVWDNGSGERLPKLNEYNLDAGLMLQLGSGLSLGVSAQNLLETDEQEILPKIAGVGIGFGGDVFTAAFDVNMNLNDGADRQLTYHTGLEYELAGAAFLRAGYARMPFINRKGDEKKENLLSAGAGWGTPQGALDITYSGSLERGNNWQVVGGIRVYQ